MSKSRVWDYFKKSNEKFAKCSLCKREYKLSGNTTNLIDHMKRKHNKAWSSTVSANQYEDTTEQNEQICGPSPKKRNTVKNYFDRSSKYLDGKTKQNLDKKYVRMIAVDMEPLRKGEHEEFRDFVNTLDSRYEIPDTTTLKKKLLPQYYENVKQKLVIALSQAEHVSVTTDLWTSIANEGILSITGHFFHNEKLIAPLLEVVKMEGSHNAENIASVLDASLLKWGIRSKCEAITTDNAQTMINAAAKLQIRHIPCFAHSLNLTKKGFKTSDDEKRAAQWLEKTYASHLAKERLAVEETQPTPSKSSGTSNDLLGFLDVPDVSTPLSNSLVDVRQYLEKPVIDRKECPVKYWRYTNNRLKELAMLYLCIPASSVPSERIFSKAGQILTERRNRLKDKRLNELLFIKQNYSYFDD
ncbi:hypothetical protein PYW07_006240 [Mythimna separata]|uniref:BED-type domain-containing protein n=1 Tax=Mythimna separata TaxID=271217 RepID=A0AAD7YVN3_MYTSE|nr:hypothetical protein PYW07_006240 [Mythimna separata]